MLLSLSSAQVERLFFWTSPDVSNIRAFFYNGVRLTAILNRYHLEKLKLKPGDQFPKAWGAILKKKAKGGFCRLPPKGWLVPSIALIVIHKFFGYRGHS